MQTIMKFYPATVFVFLSGALWSVTVIANECPAGVPLVNCFVDPCQVSDGCPTHPQAECRSNFCGGCNADYYIGNEKVNCTECPASSPRTHCGFDPCLVSTGCPSYPLAECRANYCGGCNTEYYVQNRRVDCSVCPNNRPILECTNPCHFARPAPGYICVPDFCSGPRCSLKFVKLCEDGSKPVACLHDPCLLAFCPARHNCVSNYCGRCRADCVPKTLLK